MNSEIKSPVFAVMTDFSFDFSVASMKGLILKDFPGAQIIDIDHSIKQFSILSGAFVINNVYEYFPEQTIFICVVDPGVGSKREPIVIDIGNYRFIGPNNGLFHYLLRNRELSHKAYVIKEEFRSSHSNTFHGRDFFTPAGIEIAKGNYEIVLPFDEAKLNFIPALENGSTVITYIDGFGNIKTNIPVDEKLKGNLHIEIGINSNDYKIKFTNTFSDVPNGDLLCYKGSNDTLEIAANLASAKKILDVEVGDNINIQR